MSQHSLFSEQEGERLRDRAIEKVDISANADWKDRAHEILFDVASRVSEFTTDEVWAGLSADRALHTHEPRAMGAVMQWAAKSGVIRTTSRFRLSRRPQCHRRPLRIWASMVLHSGLRRRR